VKDTENFYAFFFYSINDEIRGIGNDNFSTSFYRPTLPRKGNSASSSTALLIIKINGLAASG
jgi:hypothetical protein